MKTAGVLPRRSFIRVGLPALAAWPLLLALAAPPGAAAQAASDDTTVPGDFSIYNPAPGQLAVRTSPKNLPIYVFDDDLAGKSNCNVGCTGPWSPVVPSGASKAFGNWTIIAREDHREQWAYKGHPLYTYFTDTPGKPTGDGAEGKWHLFHL